MKVEICCYSLLVAEGIKKLIEGEPSIQVIASQGNHKFEGIAEDSPDLFIADLDTFFDHSEPLLNNVNSKVLVIYNTSRQPSLNGQLSEYISKGLAGILPPETDAVLLKRAIKAVSSGELWINHKSLRDMLVSGQQRADLTRQEGQVVYYICRGYRNKEIAQKLDITEQTVKSHCNRIYKKFGVTDRLQLALLLMHDKSVIKRGQKIEVDG